MSKVIGVIYLACAVTSSSIELSQSKAITSSDHASVLVERKLNALDDIIFNITRDSFPQLTEDEYDTFMSFYSALGVDATDEECYNESADFFSFEPRAVPFFAGKGDNFDTREECVTQCLSMGYPISGTANQETCFCANKDGYEVGSDTILFSEYGLATSCDCSNLLDNQICVTQVSLAYETVGCFRDEIPRALPIVPGSGISSTDPLPISGKSFLQCALLCFTEDTGYQYMGRQFDQECWCGSGFTHHIYGEIEEGDDEFCDCDGTNIGFFKQCIYKVRDDVWEDKILFLGSYSDFGDPNIESTTDDTRALPDKQVGNFDSIDECARQCRNSYYDLFALQHEMECWCADSFVDDVYRYGATTSADCDNVEDIGFFVFCLFAITDPLEAPSLSPSLLPSNPPTVTISPTLYPSEKPSISPSNLPTSIMMTMSPTVFPTPDPTP